MKLFLSSIRLPNQEEHTKLFDNRSTISVAVVPNAWDTYPEDRQKVELANTLAEFEKLGYKTTVIDLTTSNSNVKENLEPYDFIWIMGGNTFYLNYKIRMTGFDKTLRTAVANGLVYGGTSAGAVVAGPTIHGAENVDDPSDAPKVIWDGLGLVDFGIVPHWGMEKYASNLEKMRDDMQPHVGQIIKLTNDEAVLEVDGKRQVR